MSQKIGGLEQGQLGEAAGGAGAGFEQPFVDMAFRQAGVLVGEVAR
jgi:hypothetical protein